MTVFENRVLKRIFGPKRDEEVEKTTQEGALCCVLLNKYYSSDQIKRTAMNTACSMYGESRGAYRALVGIPEGRRRLGRPRRR